MNFQSSIILLLAFCFCLSCTNSEKITKSNYQILKSPPSGILVNDTLFCDQTEISNFYWLEYLFWNKRVFGTDSKEYLKTIPDSTVWNIDTCLSVFYLSDYLYHPAYRDYPVVGITQEQALDFSKWRSDRVFELLLIELNIISYDTNQTKDNYFTIEKYYMGNTFEDKLNYYPEFRLPNLIERKEILEYSDSIDQFYFSKCNSKFCVECKNNFPLFISDIIPCYRDTNNIDPTININSGAYSNEKKSIKNLRGNVSEFTTEKNISVGGGWHDTREQILKSDTFLTDKPNSWTGFRNVFEWKKWKQ